MHFNTLLRYHLHINPDDLDDETWWLTVLALKHIREQEAKQAEKNKPRFKK